jgi:hypothetical protein
MDNVQNCGSYVNIPSSQTLDVRCNVIHSMSRALWNGILFETLIVVDLLITVLTTSCYWGYIIYKRELIIFYYIYCV